MVTFDEFGVYQSFVSGFSAEGCEGSEFGPVVVAVGCSPEIPELATVYTDTGQTSPTGGTSWICDGGEVTNESGLVQIFFVESGGELTVGGGGTFVVYVRTGGTVNKVAGGAFNIISEAGAILNGFGGEDEEFLACADLNFDLSNAPDPACP